jgi:PAS domain-containing protein
MSGDRALPRSRPEPVDYRLVFDAMPGMCLILDGAFRIVAQNADHAKATLSKNKDIVGKGLFEVFPDNPADYHAYGVATVRESLVKVMQTRAPDVMPTIRYDVQPESGPFEARYWVITNTPILGEDGFVRWIINRAEDVTEWVRAPNKSAGGSRDPAPGTSP